MQQDMIVILDLGSHENTMVARAVRELGVYSEIKPHDITAAELKELPNVKGIIINGGENQYYRRSADRRGSSRLSVWRAGNVCRPYFG